MARFDDWDFSLFVFFFPYRSMCASVTLLFAWIFLIIFTDVASPCQNEPRNRRGIKKGSKFKKYIRVEIESRS